MATITVATPTPAPAPITVPILEVASPPKFSGERGQVVGFINACCLFMQMRMKLGIGIGLVRSYHMFKEG